MDVLLRFLEVSALAGVAAFVLILVLTPFADRPDLRKCHQASIEMFEPVAALWCVALPVFDTLVVIARRLKNGRSPFSPDRKHLHHLLVDQGAPPRVALAVILCASLVVNIAGIAVSYVFGAWFGLLAYGAALIGFGYLTLHPEIERRFLKKAGLISGRPSLY